VLLPWRSITVRYTFLHNFHQVLPIYSHVYIREAVLGVYEVVLYVVCLSARHLAVDCIMADDWQPWSACSSRCGLGTRRRTRRVVRTASNGGRPCPSTVQKGICYGTGCKFARAHGRVQMQGNRWPATVDLNEERRLRQDNWCSRSVRSPVCF